MTHVDGSPLTETERRRKLVVTSTHRNQNYEEVTDLIDSDVSIPENGIIRLDLTFPDDAASATYQVGFQIYFLEHIILSMVDAVGQSKIPF